MSIAIRYTYLVDNTERRAAWHGDVDDAVEAGARALGAYSRDEEATWIYRADETGTDWQVSRRDLATLGAALLDGRDMSEVYSIWCAGSSATEIAAAQADG